jgi:putative addiction module killer protein
VRDSAEREKWLEDARVGEYSALWLNSFLTYRNALILVGLLDSLPVQSKLPPKELEGLLAIEDTKLRHDKAWNLYGATPVAHGPLGQATRDMLRGLLPFLLRIRLVDDLLLQNRVTLSTQGYSQLLRGHERPWELMALRQTGRLLATAEFLDQVSPFLSHQERSKLVEAAMGAKDPIARTKQALGIATVEAQEVREEILLPKVALLPNVRHFLKETLAEKHAHPDPALMARKLAKLYEHGHCTLEQIVSGLEKNSAPEDLLESLYLESTLRRLPEEALSRAKPAFDPLTQKPAAAPTDAGIQITFTPEFEEWRAGLDSENAARVEARLYRASEGNLGDSRGVRGKLTELRLHHGAGLRIYLRREGPSKATILFGGTKSTQAEDIEHSLRLANLSAESEQ